MYRIIFWLQGKIYKVQPDGQLAPAIIKQTEHFPFQTEIIVSEAESKLKIDELTKTITQKLSEIIGEINNVGEVG